ncbi:MAG: hypothetical protein VX733_06700 [Candidatus Latescibacterota bacterium]|nr:hypothetical protein [Candidatus Latescibacterota bacterium]
MDAIAARVLTEHMVTADLWGRATHGMSSRFPAILERARRGVGRQPPETVRDDGDSLAEVSATLELLCYRHVGDQGGPLSDIFKGNGAAVPDDGSGRAYAPHLNGLCPGIGIRRSQA